MIRTLPPILPRDQPKNGGALKLHLGAVGVFKGTATFTDVSIMPADTGDDEVTYRKGACIHNKVCISAFSASTSE